MAKAKPMKPLPPLELSAFFASFAMLLHAGVPANECAGIIADDMKSGPIGQVARNIENIFSSGDVFVFSQAMQITGAFPAYAVEMMQLGEESGRTETSAEALGEYYRNQAELRQNIRSAVSGPLLLLVMMSAVLFFLIIFVLPVYDRVFTSLGIAGGGLGGANIATRIAMVVVGALILLFLLGLMLYLFPKGRTVLQGLAQVFRPTRKIAYVIAASRLTNGLEMLLSSGISGGEALAKAGALVNNKQITKKLPACIQAVEQGEDLGKALVSSGILVGFEARVLISASRAGQTEVAMGRLSQVYANQANAGIDKVISIIEPALVGLLSVAIGVILLSVMLPLVNIMGALN